MWTGKGDARNGDTGFAVYNQIGELVLDGLTFLQMTTIVMAHNKQIEQTRRIIATLMY